MPTTQNLFNTVAFNFSSFANHLSSKNCFSFEKRWQSKGNTSWELAICKNIDKLGAMIFARVPSHAQFRVTLGGNNLLYGHAGNFDTVFIYQQISNFTNYDPLVMLKNCKHRTSPFIRRNIDRSITSFIIVNVFPFFLQMLYITM